MAGQSAELKEFGKRVAQLRYTLGKSGAELAFDCGISTNAIYAIESGKSEAKLTTVKAIASSLNCSVDYLLYGDQATSCSRSEGKLSALTQKAQTVLNATKLEAFIKQSLSLIETLEAL